MVSIKVKFIPLGDRIVIMPLEGEQTTKGGIYLPDTAAVGDRVIYSKYAGTEYKDGDEEYLILRESDILAKIS